MGQPRISFPSDEWHDLVALHAGTTTAAVLNRLAVEHGVDTVQDQSVQPVWCTSLPLQQQSVMLLGARGPDGVDKKHPCKNIVRAYRATVLVAATRRRELYWGERADSFMSLDRFADEDAWAEDVKAFFNGIDSLPYHYVLHLAHGAEIIGYRHPDLRFRQRWIGFYYRWTEDAHVWPEALDQMHLRLNDVFGPEREA